MQSLIMHTMITSVLYKCSLIFFSISTKSLEDRRNKGLSLQKYEMCCDMLDLVADVSNIYTTPECFSFYDSKSFSSVHLDNGTVSTDLITIFCISKLCIQIPEVLSCLD